MSGGKNWCIRVRGNAGIHWRVSGQKAGPGRPKGHDKGGHTNGCHDRGDRVVRREKATVGFPEYSNTDGNRWHAGTQHALLTSQGVMDIVEVKTQVDSLASSSKQSAPAVVVIRDMETVSLAIQSRVCGSRQVNDVEDPRVRCLVS